MSNVNFAAIVAKIAGMQPATDPKDKVINEIKVYLKILDMSYQNPTVANNVDDATKGVNAIDTIKKVIANKDAVTVAELETCRDKIKEIIDGVESALYAKMFENIAKNPDGCLEDLINGVEPESTEDSDTAVQITGIPGVGTINLGDVISKLSALFGAH